MNYFTRASEDAADFYWETSDEIKKQVSGSLYAQNDRHISVPVWMQAWEEVGMKIHYSIIEGNYGQRVLRK
jgi:hypothetical protein